MLFSKKNNISDFLFFFLNIETVVRKCYANIRRVIMIVSIATIFFFMYENSSFDSITYAAYELLHP